MTKRGRQSSISPSTHLLDDPVIGPHFSHLLEINHDRSERALATLVAVLACNHLESQTCLPNLGKANYQIQSCPRSDGCHEFHRNANERTATSMIGGQLEPSISIQNGFPCLVDRFQADCNQSWRVDYSRRITVAKGNGPAGEDCFAHLVVCRHWPTAASLLSPKWRANARFARRAVEVVFTLASPSTTMRSPTEQVVASTA